MADIYLIQVRRDTAANWSALNPTLASGEPGLETDTKRLKIGDGATAWNDLGIFYQPTNAGLDEIAALATDSYGVGLLELTDAASLREYTGTVSQDDFDDLRQKFRTLALFLVEQGIELPDDLLTELESV